MAKPEFMSLLLKSLERSIRTKIHFFELLLVCFLGILFIEYTVFFVAQINRSDAVIAPDTILTEPKIIRIRTLYRIKTIRAGIQPEALIAIFALGTRREIE